VSSIPVLDVWGMNNEHRQGGRGAAFRAISLDQDWLFGGKLDPAALQPGFDDTTFSKITLPHCVTPLSWQNWQPSAWEDVWIYRRHFTIPAELRGLRAFLHFDRVMAGAGPVLNGSTLPQHLGGFLPFKYEVTNLMKEKNELSIAVDARWLNVPPSGSPRGPRSIDYLLPGGINGSASLRLVPTVFISNVFAKPVSVLDSKRRLEVACRIDAGATLPIPVRVEATLLEGARKIAFTSESATLEKADQEVNLTLSELGDIVLWDVDRPYLYDLAVTLFVGDKPLHNYRTRVGFRDARFDVDGFFLNGRRLHLFGLDRHELYPYVGFSASTRALRRDAEILRRDFNCNVVRCSHYPQSEAFLDACDELGLMVWEETPGWQYLGDESWKKLVLRDVEEMVLRDRNHPSVIIWGVRVNESNNDPDLYRRTRQIAKSLDDSRPTSGSMTPDSIKNWREEWHQDVFAFDDYHAAADGTVAIRPPLPGVPYLVTEAVGQFDYGGNSFTRKYRRAGDASIQMQQALLHAQAHSKAADYPRCAGLIAWCAFDYPSLMNAYNNVKCPGVADILRIPKLGASFYMAQGDPAVKPVIEPNFYWYFGPQTPLGPGEHVAIFSNCDRLEVSIDGKPSQVLQPDRTGFPHLKYPPFWASLTADAATTPELRINGYVDNRLVLSRSFSADHSTDHLWLHADHRELYRDGSDTTRVAFGAADKFGAPRPFVCGEVSLRIEGPGVIVGDNPFQLQDSGGVGAVWIKTLAGRAGEIRIEASHEALGSESLTINVINPRSQLA
jgi:beta-galactosidase